MTKLQAAPHFSIAGRDLVAGHLARVVALATMIGLGIVAVILQYKWNANGYMTDDAFISFRYSLNLADGQGIVWNPGERVEGYTNFGWVLLIALAQKFGTSPVDSSRVFGLASSAGVLAVIPFLAAQLRDAWTPRWWILTAGAMSAVALNTGFSLWTFAGLETPGFTLLLTLAIALHLYEERTDATPWLSALAFVGAALLRPDAVVAWLLVGAFKSARLIAPGRMARLRRIAVWAAIFLLAYGSYWLWRWNYYGDFFPNTYYLKTDRNGAMMERGWRYFWDFFTVYWMWLSALGLFSLWNERHAWFRPATSLLVIIAVWCLYVIDSGGDWMPFYRFFMPVIPILYVLIAHGGIDGADWLARRVRVGALGAALGVALAAVLVFSSVRPHDTEEARNPAGFVANAEILPGAVNVDMHRSIGLWMRDNLPPEYHVALIASGIVPYYSGLPSIDMLGVNDRHIAHLDIPLGHGAAGHEKEDGGYVISRAPEIIWLDIATEPVKRDSMADYMPPLYAEWVPVKTDVTTNAYIWFLYRPVAIRLPSGWLNLLVHRSVALDALPASVEP